MSITELLKGTLARNGFKALLYALENKSPQEAVGELIGCFNSLVKMFDDGLAASLVPIIALAIDEANPDESLVAMVPGLGEILAGIPDTERHRVRDELSRHLESFKIVRFAAQAECFFDLYGGLPAEAKDGSSGFLHETKKVLIKSLLKIWVRTPDDEKAQVHWARFLGLTLVTYPQHRKEYNWKSLILDQLREATDERVSVTRLNHAILILSLADRATRSQFKIFADRPQGVEEILRVLLIARARNVSLNQPYNPEPSEVVMAGGREVEILSPLVGLSNFAYETMRDEAVAVATQDRSSKNLYEKIKGEIRGINLDLHFLYPDRQTIIIKLVWDESLRGCRSGWYRPEDRDMYRALEIVLRLVSEWRSYRHQAQLTTRYKVKVVLVACERVAGGIKSEKIFREETVN